MLMDKYPIIVWIGAAVLGRVGGEMIITDPWVVVKITPGATLQYACEILGAAGVILFSKFYMRWKIGRQAEALAKGAKAAE